MNDQSISADQRCAKESSIPAHSPFMPGRSGNCIFAICNEADERDVLQEIDKYLNSAAAIMYLVMKDEIEADRSVLQGVLRLIEIAEGMVRSQVSE